MDRNPKFVSKRNRTTIIEEERRNKILREREIRDKKIKYEIGAVNRSELDSTLLITNCEQSSHEIAVTNDKISEYNKWKIRELKRLKREYLDHLDVEKSKKVDIHISY